MNSPELTPSSLAKRETICVYLDEVYALSRMCFELIASQMLDDVYREYKIILKEKNIGHQFICGISSGGFLLGCIDPVYRHGKPLKYLMDTRNMILAMCDRDSMSNSGYNNFPVLHDVNTRAGKTGFRFRVEQFELIPLAVTQRQDVHYTFRKFIEFNHVDTYGSLRNFRSTLLMSNVGAHRQEDEFKELPLQNFNQTQFNQVWLPTQENSNDRDIWFDDFLESL